MYILTCYSLPALPPLHPFHGVHTQAKRSIVITVKYASKSLSSVLAGAYSGAFGVSKMVTMTAKRLSCSIV